MRDSHALAAVSDVQVPDLDAVERTVAAAIVARNSDGVRLLGFGEISIVLGWPADSPEHALKRVPPFRDAAAAAQYVDVCERWFDRLRAAAVPMLATSLHTTTRADGTVVVYHRQPVADATRLGVNVLRACEPDADHPLLATIIGHAQAVVEPGRVGFDVQAANWLWDGSEAQQLDFSSPFVLNDSGDDLCFDTSGFLREYPAVLRPLLRKELLRLIVRFTTAEGAVGDMAGNLLKEGLEPWVDPTIEAARRFGVRIDSDSVTKLYNDDRKLLPLTLRLKKAQRFWLSHTGRRYDSMLPERTTYGK